MLKFQWRPTVSDVPIDPPSSLASEHPDLTIRSLLDDPRLRRALGLELASVSTPPDASVAAPVRPEPVFNRRRLLERDAA